MALSPAIVPSAARAAQLGIELLTLDELLGRADFISVHLPKTPETAGLIDKDALAKTKPGVIIVNAARGGLIDEAALADAISSGHVRAAGLDVFSKEPCTDSPLFELAQVVVTPHLGASTEEAQDRAGTDVAASVKLALAGEFVPDAVNVGGGVVSEEVAPWLDLVRKLGLLAGALSEELPTSLSVQVRGELADEQVEVLRLSALRGLFSAVIEDQAALDDTSVNKVVVGFMDPGRPARARPRHPDFDHGEEARRVPGQNDAQGPRRRRDQAGDDRRAPRSLRARQPGCRFGVRRRRGGARGGRMRRASSMTVEPSRESEDMPRLDRLGDYLKKLRAEESKGKEAKGKRPAARQLKVRSKRDGRKK